MATLEEVLQIVADSPAAAALEPLIGALQLDLGLQLIAPQEIACVAEDILRDIRARRAGLETSDPAG